MPLSRRNFLTNSAAVVCGAMLSTELESCSIGKLLYHSGDIPVLEGPALLDLAAESSLQHIGGAVKKRYSSVNDGDVILVIRISEREFAAYAAQCTHYGAEVNTPVDGVMVCPFHGSRYKAADGSVLQGPAKEPLRRLIAEFDENKKQLLIKEV